MTSSLSTNPVKERRGPGFALWVLLVSFAAANVLPVFPHAFSPVLYAAGQIVPAAIFALIHCTRVYRLRGAVIFTSIGLAVGYTMEFLGVHTGFPFGQYHFTGGMGPRLLGVPILMGPAYVGMGYVSWSVARLILSGENRREWLTGPRLLALPLVASFAMVGWDLSFDPALSTFGHYWIWLQGGAYFGVPVSNFLGWFLTNFLIYQLFALYLRSCSTDVGLLYPVEARLAVIFYAVCAAGCALRAASNPAPAVVADAAGAMWRVRDINNVCALTAIFVMGPFVVLAATKLIGRSQPLSGSGSNMPGDGGELFSPVPSAEELERVP